MIEEVLADLISINDGCDAMACEVGGGTDA